MPRSPTRPSAATHAERPDPGVRLQRVLAAAGVGARRACERLIEEGRVAVNGERIDRLPAFVDPQTDHITVDGRPITRQRQRPVYIMVNKPERVLTTSADEPEMGRKTVLDLVDHPAKPRLFPVGRLDWSTTGLVLLTNDGALANRLTHPSYGVSRTYRAVVKGALDAPALERLQGQIAREIRKSAKRAGKVSPGGAALGTLELAIESRQTGKPRDFRHNSPPRTPNSELRTSHSELRTPNSELGSTTLLIRVKEGRTGNLAKMLSAAGVPVRKLERIAIGPVALTEVARGRWRELDRAEIGALKAAARGVDAEVKRPHRPRSPHPRAPRGSRGPRSSSAPGGRRPQ